MAGTRVAVVASFVLFVLLAAPLAWQLTRVERVPLPAARIFRLAPAASPGANASRSAMTVAVYARGSAVVELPRSAGVSFERRKLMANPAAFPTAEAQRQLVDDRLRDVVGRSASPAALSIVLLCPEEDTAGGDSPPPLVVGKYRHAWTSTCDLKRGSGLFHAVERLVRDHLTQPQRQGEDGGSARMALQYRLRFTLLKADPSTPWTWDFPDLSARYLQPLMRKAGVLADLTEESQVAQYARLARDIHRVEAEGGDPFFYVAADDLKHFKSANDFLASSVLADREQVLHFMAALPEEKHAPLVIHDRDRDDKPRRDGAKAFEIPGWGVVAILDPHLLLPDRDGEGKGSVNPNQERELQRVMGLFIAEFRRLIGAPSFFHRQRAEKAAAETTGQVLIEFLPSIVDGLADWELDVLVRARYHRLLQTTAETLASIVQLVDDMPEMSVLARVQQRISAAVELMESILCLDGDDEQSRRPTCAPADVESRLRLVREAAALTDAAYYDHTMIRQLYFPQEQMLGVYAPLLAPLILPFFLGLVREVKRWKQKRKAKQDKAKQE